MQSIERARQNHKTVLNAMALTGLRPIAEGVGVDESTLSKWKESGQIERFSKLLAECGLKVVPQSMRCFNVADVEALMHFARQRMESLRSADDLLPWGEDPE